jgi:hypothetical protein
MVKHGCAFLDFRLSPNNFEAARATRLPHRRYPFILAIDGGFCFGGPSPPNLCRDILFQLVRRLCVAQSVGVLSARSASTARRVQITGLSRPAPCNYLWLSCPVGRDCAPSFFVDKRSSGSPEIVLVRFVVLDLGCSFHPRGFPNSWYVRGMSRGLAVRL